MNRSENLKVTVPPQLARLIRQKVKTGRYADAGEVVREALRLMEKQEAYEKRRLEQFSDDAGWEKLLATEDQERIRAGVAAGLADVESGRFEEYDADQFRQLPRDLVSEASKRRSRRKKG